MIAAPASGAGKTVATLALLRALCDAGVAAAGAKSGPDYIDPGFHEAACRAPSVNLDAWAMTPGRLARLAARQPGDLLLIEAAMGLFDGAPDPERPEGRGSAADLAAALGAPVLLVLDAAKTAQSLAAVARGFIAHRPDIRIAGLLLNRVGSARHERMIRSALASLEPPVLGALPRDPRLAAPERHLGLVQAGERADLDGFLAAAGALAAEHVDLDALRALAAPLPAPGPNGPGLPPPGQRIALARDEAFGFAYPHLLADWRAAGAEIAPFSPLADEAPDADADAVFLPGGYPELHAPRLSQAARFRAGLKAAAARGAAIHGECGGYMALGDGLVDARGARWPMAGLLRLETSFAARKLHLGYRTLHPQPGAPCHGPLLAHEFHYATTLGAQGAPLFRMADAEGADLGLTGLREGRVTGSFAHVIDTGAPLTPS